MTHKEDVPGQIDLAKKWVFRGEWRQYDTRQNIRLEQRGYMLTSRESDFGFLKIGLLHPRPLSQMIVLLSGTQVNFNLAGYSGKRTKSLPLKEERSANAGGTPWLMCTSAKLEGVVKFPASNEGVEGLKQVFIITLF